VQPGRNLRVGAVALRSQPAPDHGRDTARLRDGSIANDGIVTERIGLSDIVEGGFEELTEHKDRHVKILVRSSE